jgi:hypothetical protein
VVIYVYHRGSGEIVTYEWGKRELKTAKKLRKRIQRPGISYDRIGTDDWDSFLSAFAEDNHDTGEETHGRDRREQLPDEAGDKAGIWEDVLFFQEAAKSLGCVCHGVFLHQLWLYLIPVTLCGSPSGEKLLTIAAIAPPVAR